MFLGTTGQEEIPWQEKFPAPRTTEPSAITREELLARFEAGQQGGQDFLLVDVRRTDHEVSQREYFVEFFSGKFPSRRSTAKGLCLEIHTGTQFQDKSMALSGKHSG